MHKHVRHTPRADTRGKAWGRRALWPGFEPVASDTPPVGEIWFEGAQDAELLVKYLFTGERLSIQVHPDDATARAGGYPRGKDEAWVALAAEPDSIIALGLRKTVDRKTLRRAALNGSIEGLMNWRSVNAGEVIYSPAGTIHAIGAGITLIEVQQNVDLTYRLYDYGRPRQLHLDEGIAVSKARPFTPVTHPRRIDQHRTVLADGPKLSLERWTGEAHQIVKPGWFVPVAGTGGLDGQSWRAGECWLIEQEAETYLNSGAVALFASGKT